MGRDATGVVGGVIDGGPALDDLLPAAVAVAVAVTDDPDAWLAPAEEPAVARAVATRRAEFVTGRACARAALARLGIPSAAVPVGERRSPVWPDGVVGSITHCAGFRGAAVAWASEIRSLGIDAEPDGPLPDGVLDAVSDDAERAHLARLPSGVSWDRLLFSAKESVYKAWFPLTGRWLGFQDAAMVIDPAGRFTATLRVPGPWVDGREVGAFAGRWAVRGGIVVTAVTLAPR